MLAETLEDGFALTFGDFALEFRESEMNDVVMVDFLAFQFVTESQPYIVEKIDFLGREVGRVRTEIENMLVATGSDDVEGEARARLRHVFPGKADFAGLFGQSHLRGTADHD